MEELHYPDRLIFALDSPDDDFEPVRSAALLLHDVLKEVRLVPFVMTCI